MIFEAVLVLIYRENVLTSRRAFTEFFKNFNKAMEDATRQWASALAPLKELVEAFEKGKEVKMQHPGTP